jgi:hypothetical protein
MDVKLKNIKFIILFLTLIFIFQVIIGYLYFFSDAGLSDYSFAIAFITMINFTLFAWLFVKYLNN